MIIIVIFIVGTPRKFLKVWKNYYYFFCIVWYFLLLSYCFPLSLMSYMIIWRGCS